MATYKELNDGFYNGLLTGLGFSKGDPIQVIQPSPPIASGVEADTLLWNYFNNIPPFSLTQNTTLSGGAQFLSNYQALLANLLAAGDTFDETVGETCSTEWKNYLRSIQPPIPLSSYPLTFRGWAMMSDNCSSVATSGASALAASLLDPIFAAQMAVLPYKPAGMNSVSFVPGYQQLMSQLSAAPSREFDFDSQSMDSNVENSWTSGSNSGFFGLWGGSSSESNASKTFASDRVQLSAAFQNVLNFISTPGDWYTSSAMALAYGNESGPPWDPNKPQSWENFFGSNGLLPRFAVNLIVANGMDIAVTSQAEFSSEEQQEIRENSSKGLWPFYSGSNGSTSSTKAEFDASGSMTVRITSVPGNPIVIGCSVLPVEQYVGHEVEVAKAHFRATRDLLGVASY